MDAYSRTASAGLFAPKWIFPPNAAESLKGLSGIST